MLQRQLSNGSWINEDREGYFLDLAIKFDSLLAPRLNCQPMTTHQEILDYLAAGKTVTYSGDWYANLRDGDAHAKLVELDRQKRNSDPNYSSRGWVLDCGHTVNYRSYIMNASRGTTCTDCYDRMSN